MTPRGLMTAAVLSLSLCGWRAAAQQPTPVIGDERAVTRHLAQDELEQLAPGALVDHGRMLFTAVWTRADGGGRPRSKGNGEPLSDASQPLTGLRAFNRLSGPDANSCSGCHNAPLSTIGGSGDFVSVAFAQADRFDFLTFDRKDLSPTRGSVDERGRQVSFRTVGNVRATTGLFGAGYIEMLAREMTSDLQWIRDQMRPGESARLLTKTVSFGTLRRHASGAWDVSAVQGLPAASLVSVGGARPSLILRPWDQAGNTVSLRDFTVTAFNRHHGIQARERFGSGRDPDGDGVVDELTEGDVSAVVAFLATLPVPGRVIPNDPIVEAAVLRGERLFEEIGCATCHRINLTLSAAGQTFSEPGPFNPPGTRMATEKQVRVNLTDATLPLPRLSLAADAVRAIKVPAFTDLKLHDITDPTDDTAAEAIDAGQSTGSARYFAGNRRFLTARLWGAANQPPYFHNGIYTTMRAATLAHAGEALSQRRAFEGLVEDDKNAIIEFLKTLQILPAATPSLVVDENYQPKRWGLRPGTSQ
jgi:cytochrome c peroxidase